MTLLRRSSFLALLALAGCSTMRERDIRRSPEPRQPARSPEFRQEMGALLGHGFVSGNRITTLINGDEIFPAMLGAIRRAKRSVTFETYVYIDSEVSRQLAEALAERARAGVKVLATLDAQGTSKMGRKNLALMRNAGVQVEKYHSLFWWDIRRFNQRTHRKLLVVDGTFGFIGGVGIARQWMGDAQDPEHWRENHYRVEGPVVAQMQGIFASNWLEARGEVLHGPEFFPPLPPAGGTLAQAIESSPRQGDMAVNLLYLLAIASAERSVLIENAYFIPDKMQREALMDAARRGVRVEIIVPGKHIDQKLVRLASHRDWDDMLRAGVRLYEYQPTMLHTKLMIVDGIFVSLGSANFDNRSVRINDEANLNVLDRGFAAEQTRLFEIDKRHSRAARLDEHGKVSLNTPIEQTAGLAAPQL